jgi:hypothetical protein
VEMLEGLLGDPQKQQQVSNFVQKYNKQGNNPRNYSDDEVVQNFQHVAPHLGSGHLENAARQAFEQMSPQERQQFAQWLRKQGAGKGMQPHQQYQQANPQQDQNPSSLAGMLGSMVGSGSGQHGAGTAGALMNLLTGSSGGSGNAGGSSLFSNPLAKAAMAGITAMAAKDLMGK